MLTVFHITAVVEKPTPLIGWSGSFLAKLLKSFLPRSVVVCGFSISPIMCSDRIVLSGVNSSSAVLDPGSEVFFRFTSFCRNYSAAADILNSIESGFGVLRVVDVYYQRYESSMDLLSSCSLCSSSGAVNYVDSSLRSVVEVFFGPTILVYRGWRVLHPSPQRVIFNLAKLSTEYFGTDPRISRKRARVLSRHVELIGYPGTRVVEVNIGRGRRVKAFMGRALYGVYRVDSLRDFVELLEIGRIAGVGKSRGVGFGYMDYRVLTPQELLRGGRVGGGACEADSCD